MEGNKDEALRCLDIARKHYSDGNLPQAIKFVNKSINLYPTDTARELLTTYENSSTQRQSSPEPTTSHAPKSSSSSSSQRTSRPASSSSTPPSTSSSPANERPYTPEQLQAVQRIRRLKDYYEILEITKEAKEGEIKKAYRKLALIMHPDKNGAPGAEDAFKAVSKAFACLSDPEARKRYDLHGPDAPAASPFSHHSRHSHHHPYGFESDLTPEQIFEMMFGMGRPPGGGGGFRTYTYRAGGGGPRRQQQQQADPDLSTLLMQFLPIIMLGLVFFFFASGGEDPHFSLQRTGSYIYHRETAHWGVSYWVKLETEQKLSRKSMDLGTLERDVERHWKADKDKKCSFEHQQKNRMERAAYYASGDEKEFMREKINNYPMPNCEELSKVTRVS